MNKQKYPNILFAAAVGSEFEKNHHEGFLQALDRDNVLRAWLIVKIFFLKKSHETNDSKLVE